MLPSISFTLITYVLFAQCSAAQAPSQPSASLSPSTLVSVFIASPSQSTSASVDSGARNATIICSAQSSISAKGLKAIAGPSSNVPLSGTVSGTRSAYPRPTKTRACNGYPEFCQRKFSNISMVVAHNSPFVKPHNAASNQMYPVLNQLNDGVRGCESLIASF
jgi:hypothetical protein